MSPSDKQLVMDFAEAVEDWLLLIMQTPTPLYAARKDARERLVDAIVTLATRAGEAIE